MRRYADKSNNIFEYDFWGIDTRESQSFHATPLYIKYYDSSITVRYAPELDKIILSGGGDKNNYIFENLQKRFPSICFERDEKCKFIESIGMAVFAYRRFHRISSLLTTGSNSPILLGELFD